MVTIALVRLSMALGELIEAMGSIEIDAPEGVERIVKDWD